MDRGSWAVLEAFREKCFGAAQDVGKLHPKIWGSKSSRPILIFGTTWRFPLDHSGCETPEIEDGEVNLCRRLYFLGTQSPYFGWCPALLFAES
jgi:hypothetical protein